MKKLILLVVSYLAIMTNAMSESGCTDANACNYDTEAVLDDGSCIAIDSILVLPDTNFMNALWLNHYDIDLNADGVFQICEAWNYNGYLWLDNQQINDLTGIEYFSNIIGLLCSNNHLSALDLSENHSITFVMCSNNDLNYLNIQNGNNIYFESGKGWDAMNAEGNPDLRCIIVDDPLYSYNADMAYDWYKDNTAYYLTDCDDGDLHSCGIPVMHNTTMQYGTVNDHEGNTYKTIEIGTQEWMAENLKVSTYRTGDSIPTHLDNAAWEAADFGAWSYYDDTATYDCPFGKLYNWYACANPAQICPVGWRIPSDEDWSLLVHFLDTNFISDSYFGNTAAIALKSLWLNGNVNIYGASNASGFSAIFGGRRTYNGFFSNQGSYGYWWSSTEEVAGGSVGFSRSISEYYDGVDQIDDSKTLGLSVRCIRDENYVELIPGCMDATACNYDTLATEDDSSCIYSAPYLNCDGICINDTDTDGVCDEFELAGCQDTTACNYDTLATEDDSSCIYSAPYLNCDGICINDTDTDGVCDEFEMAGCQDSTACNYIANATDTITDVCAYPGCTNVFACNYNSSAACNDGTCTFEGCTDSTSCNFNVNAGCDDGSCLPSGCNIPGACNYADIPCNNNTCIFPGCNDILACNYDVFAGCDDSSCIYPGCNIMSACNYDSLAGCNDNSCVFPGCIDSTACNYEPLSACDNGSCTYPGCNDTLACNYDELAGCNDGSCLFPGCLDSTSCNYNPTAICEGICYGQEGNACDDNDAATINDVVTADCLCVGELPAVPGCTDTLACNYTALATDDDGSCEYAQLYFDCSGNCLNDTDNDGVCDEFEVAGCTDTLACNYNALATDDDGSCEYALLYYDCSGNCLNDSDNDGVCDELEIPGCTDNAACNFNASATEDDGSCGLAVGTACDDQDSTTINDVIVVGCNCEGGALDLNEFNVNTLSIFPNPAQDNIIVELPNPGGAQIEIYNIAGERVFASPYSRSVDIRSLTQGMYFLKIVQDEGTAIERFEVVR